MNVSFEAPTIPPGLPAGLPVVRAGVLCEDEIRSRRVALALQRGGVDVVGEARSAGECLVRWGDRPPAVVAVVWDRLEAKRRDGWIRAVRQAWPATRILGTAVEATPRAVRDLLTEGADGFVMDGDLEVGLIAAVHGVASGQLVLPRSLREQVARPALSAREKQVLGMVVMGFSNGEIARKLHLAESTVKSHLSSIFGKLGVRSRSEAAALVLDPERGLGVGILGIPEKENEELA